MYQANNRKKHGAKGLILLFAVFAIILTGLYGCQVLQPGTDEAANVDDKVPMDRRIGILKSLGGVRTSNQGTHILQLDDGNTILLKSLQINLDDAKYLGNSVEVRGPLTYTTDNKQIMEVMNIDLVQQETSVAPDMTLWKNFESTDLAISIKYKDDLKVDEIGSSKVIFSRMISEPEGLTQEDGQENTQEQTHESLITDVQNVMKHQLVITRDDLEDGKTLLAYLGVETDEGALMASGYSKSKIGSGNYDSLKKVIGNETFYHIQAGAYVYKIIIDCGSDEKTLSDQNLFYEMIGTLKIEGATQGSQTQEEDLENDGEGSTGTQEAAVTLQEPAPDEATATQAEAASTQENIPAGGGPAAETQESQEPEDGYTTMESTSFNFSMQYPKSWYYSGSASSEQDVIRHYEFGTKPLEEAPGTVALDLMSGSMPAGTAVSINGKQVTSVSSGGTVQLYIKGDGSRVYRISGPTEQKETLLKIAGSLEE